MRPSWRPRPGTAPSTTRVGVVHGLQLLQHRAAAGHVRGIGAVQHQAFTAGRHHLVQPALQFGAAGHTALLHRLEARPVDVLPQLKPDARRVR